MRAGEHRVEQCRGAGLVAAGREQRRVLADLPRREERQVVGGEEVERRFVCVLVDLAVE
ncbi:MAG TPA: hypothetical protein VLT45_16120 [Kofleriaceae bacterium]|nr:hypothetical protein [Kofleriaceae bacterium]